MLACLLAAPLTAECANVIHRLGREAVAFVPASAEDERQMAIVHIAMFDAGTYNEAGIAIRGIWTDPKTRSAEGCRRRRFTELTQPSSVRGVRTRLRGQVLTN